MSFLIPGIGAGLSLISGLIGSNAANHEDQQIQQLLNQISKQQQGVQGNLESSIGGIQGTAAGYLGLLPGLLSSLQSENKGVGAQAPGAALQFLQNALSPSALAGTTGINAGGLAGLATNYLSNPGATNLSQVTPGLESFYKQEEATGLNPQVQQNAQNQLLQQFDSSLDTLEGQAAPGQNLAGAQQALQNNLLTASTNLGGQLAGESQQYKNIGAQGVASTAGALDQQTMSMLMNAFGLGNQYNQTVLGNQQSGAGFGQNILDQLGQTANVGNSLNEYASSSLGSLNSSLMSQADYLTGLGQNAASAAGANNPFSALANSLSFLPTGGGAGSGTATVGTDTDADLPAPESYAPAGFSFNPSLAQVPSASPGNYSYTGPYPSLLNNTMSGMPTGLYGLGQYAA
jgi:hypothetical protein